MSRTRLHSINIGIAIIVALVACSVAKAQNNIMHDWPHAAMDYTYDKIHKNGYY